MSRDGFTEAVRAARDDWHRITGRRMPTAHVQSLWYNDGRTRLFMDPLPEAPFQSGRRTQR